MELLEKYDAKMVNIYFK